MAEAVPLGSGLSVQLVLVIVCKVLGKRLDFVLELLATKCRYFWDIQGQTACGVSLGLPRFRSCVLT